MNIQNYAAKLNGTNTSLMAHYKYVSGTNTSFHISYNLDHYTELASPERQIYHQAVIFLH